MDCLTVSFYSQNKDKQKIDIVPTAEGCKLRLLALNASIPIQQSRKWAYLVQVGPFVRLDELEETIRDFFKNNRTDNAKTVRDIKSHCKLHAIPVKEYVNGEWVVVGTSGDMIKAFTHLMDENSKLKYWRATAELMEKSKDAIK